MITAYKSIRTMRHSEPGFGEFVGVKRFELARLIEVLVHAVVGLHLGRLLLQVVGAVRVDLHLRLALLAARRVLLEVDADELPFLGPFGCLGGSESLHLLGRRLADLARVPHLRLVALGFDDVGGGGFVPQLELEVEALAFLRTAVGVLAGNELLLPVVVPEVDHCHLLEPPELLLLAAVAAQAAAMRLVVPARKEVGFEFGLLVADVYGLADLLFLFGEGRAEGLLGLAGLFGAGLGGVGLVGVVARPLVLLARLALEEVKRLVHAIILSQLLPPTNTTNPQPIHSQSTTNTTNPLLIHRATISRVEEAQSEVPHDGHLNALESGAFRLVLPQHLHFPAFLLAADVHPEGPERAQVGGLGDFFCEFFEGVGGEAEESLEAVVAVFFVLVEGEEAVVDGFEQFGERLQGESEVFLEFLEGVFLVGAVVEFDQGAEQVVEHEPEVGEVGGLALRPLQRAPEEVVEQLVPLLVAGHRQLRRLHQLHDLDGDRLLDLARLLRLLLLLELDRQALLDAEAGLAVDLFELGPLGYFLALVEEHPLALAELLLEDELAGHEHLAGDDDAEEAAVCVEELCVFGHQLVEPQDLLLDAAQQRVVPRLPHPLVPEQETVKLLQQREQHAPQLEQPLAHPRPHRDVAPAQARLPPLPLLRLRTVSQARLPQPFPVAAQEAVVYDKPDDLVLLGELALGRPQEEGLGLRLGHFFEEVVEFGEFDERHYFARLHLGHLVVEGGLLPARPHSLLPPAFRLARCALAHIFNSITESPPLALIRLSRRHTSQTPSTPHNHHAHRTPHSPPIASRFSRKITGGGSGKPGQQVTGRALEWTADKGEGEVGVCGAGG